MKPEQKERLSPINHHGLTMKEIAEEIGVSPQRVEQILKEALAKMKNKLKRKGLTKGDFL